MFRGEDLFISFLCHFRETETHSQFNFIMCRRVDERGERAKVLKSPVGKLILLSLKIRRHFGVKDNGPDVVSWV